MNIRYTGVRNYECVTSSEKGKQCRGTVMILRRNSSMCYPPSKTSVDKLSITDTRDKLSQYEFFHNLSPEERISYLRSVEVPDKKLYLSDLTDMYVKFKAVGFYKTQGKKLTPIFDEETIERLLSDNPEDREGFWPLNYVYNLFPRKSGSKAVRHTLIFRPGNWTLCKKEADKPKIFTGLCCYIYTGDAGNLTVDRGKFNVYEFPQIAIITDKVTIKEFSSKDLVGIAIRLVGNEEVYTEIIQRLDNFSLSFLKSLLQKIIRFRPKTVEDIDSEIYLLATFIAVYSHPGSFIPNKQRYVTGKESAVKRLAVSIVEDSYIDSKECLISLLASALLFREKISFSPDEDLIYNWMKFAILSLRSSSYYLYDTKSEIVIEECKILHILLSSIGSFGSDIKMIGSIRGFVETGIDYSEEMKISHAVDQHCYPDIAWFVEDNELDYPKLFSLIWENLSSINPRKPKEIQEDFKYKISQAQELFLSVKETTSSSREKISGNYSFSTVLDDSHISSIIGILEFKIGKVYTYTVISPKDTADFKVFLRPSRNSKPLTEEQKELSLNNLIKRLHDGITVKDEYIDKIYYRNEIYFVQKGDSIKTWNDFKTFSFTLPLHPVMEKSLSNAIKYTGEGVEERADEYLETLLLDTKTVKRLILYVQGHKDHISPYKIGRDGEGTEYTVSKRDTKVYQLLAKISLLYPAALEHSKNYGFKVKNKYLFNHIIERAKRKVRSNFQIGNWSKPLPETRTLYAHQVNAINQLEERNIIWIPAGMGKTAIVINHICNLIEKNNMPLYCFYTLPSSAYKNVKEQFDYRNIPNVLVNRVSDLVSLENKVCFIYHDTLRLVIEDLIDLAPSSLVIADELHKMFNETQRTTAALELVSLSSSFIAMTGTLYKDDKISRLITWLQLLYPFEVTPENYYVGISGIISMKCETSVSVERIVLEEELNSEESKEYKSITPAVLGGESLTLNFNKAVSICYLAITRRIIKEVINYLNMSEGVFVVAKNVAHASEIETELRKQGVNKISVISKANPISLTPQNESPFTGNSPYVVITTPNHCEGYDMTLYRVMISGVYFSNEATREQLERRINRVNQASEVVKIVIIHAGILTYTYEKYKGVRSMAAALKELSKETGVEVEM